MNKRLGASHLSRARENSMIALFALLLAVVFALFNADSVLGLLLPPQPVAPSTAQASGSAPEPARVVTSTETEAFLLELRSQYLDDRAATIDWWLIAVTIALAFIMLLVVIAGLLGYRIFREILDDARGYRDEAQKSVQEIAELRKQAQEGSEEIRNLREITAEQVAAFDELASVSDLVSEVPGSSDVDRATIEAIRLQRNGEIESAMTIWQGIANTMERVEPDRASRAWFSVGYLYLQTKDKDYQAAVSAFDKAIELRPAFVQAYNNRGVAKSELGQDVEAINDYDKAIDLDRTYSVAYINRGASKFNLGQLVQAKQDYALAIHHNSASAEAYCNLGEVEIKLEQHESAVENCTSAIRRNPGLGEAYYHRGRAQAALNRTADARSDFATASILAEQKNNADLKEKVEKALADLDALG